MAEMNTAAQANADEASKIKSFAASVEKIKN